MPDETPISQLRNLGPRCSEMLAAVGIHTFAELREAGPIGAYLQLRMAGFASVNVIMTYAIQGALTDRPWHDLGPGVREELRAAVREVETAPQR